MPDKRQKIQTSLPSDKHESQTYTGGTEYQICRPIDEPYSHIAVTDLVKGVRVVTTYGDGSCGPYALAAQFLRLLLQGQVRPSDEVLNRIREQLQTDRVIAELLAYADEFQPYFERYQTILADASIVRNDAWVLEIARVISEDSSGRELATEAFSRLFSPILRHWLVAELRHELTKAEIAGPIRTILQELIQDWKDRGFLSNSASLQEALRLPPGMALSEIIEQGLIDELLSPLLVYTTFLHTSHLSLLANQLQFQVDIYTRASVDNINLFLITEDEAFDPNTIQRGDIFIDQRPQDWEYHYLDSTGTLQKTPAYSQGQLVAEGCNSANLHSARLKAIIGTDISSAGFAESKSITQHWANADIEIGEMMTMSHEAQRSASTAQSSQPHVVILNPESRHYSAALLAEEQSVREIVDAMIPALAPSANTTEPEPVVTFSTGNSVITTEPTRTPPASISIASKKVAPKVKTVPMSSQTRRAQELPLQQVDISSAAKMPLMPTPQRTITQPQNISSTKGNYATRPLIQSAEAWLLQDAAGSGKDIPSSQSQQNTPTTAKSTVLAFARTVNDVTDDMLASLAACKKAMAPDVWEENAEALFKAVWDNVIVAHYDNGGVASKTELGATFNRVLADQLQTHMNVKEAQAQSIVTQSSLFKASAVFETPVNVTKAPSFHTK